MKAKYKKFLIVCGKVFMLVCLAAFALLCVFYYATPKDKAQAIQVNAEETVASATDLSKYPTVNLISYPYVDKRTTINGVTFTVNNDGTVNVNGTATARCDFSLSNYVPVTVGASYFFSGCPIGGGSDTFIFYLYDGINGFADKGEGLKVVAKVNFFVFKIIVYTGATVDNLVFKPMLNVGDVAYPYSPPYDLIYNQGYQEGENAGHEAGYDEGYKDASDTLNLGVLYGTTVSGKFSYTNGQTLTLTNGKPDFSYNGLNFNSIWGKYYHYNNDTENTLENVEMTLNFKTPFQYDGFPLYFLGDSDVMAATFISTANKRYNADIEKYNATAIGEDYALIGIREKEKEDGIEVKALTIYFGRAMDTLYNANVLSKSGGYLNGYDNGYNDGFYNGHTDGVLDGRKEGFDNGYNEGYSKGKTDAFSQLSDEPLSNSIRGFVFSLFDAPVSSFLSAFNLSYDGFDIGALVAFIFTGIVVIAVVRLLT